MNARAEELIKQLGMSRDPNARLLVERAILAAEAEATERAAKKVEELQRIYARDNERMCESVCEVCAERIREDP